MVSVGREAGEGPTFLDYAWIAGWRNGLLTNAYCLTIIDGLGVDEVMRLLHTTDRVAGATVDVLSDASYQAWERFGGDRLVVGVAAADSRKTIMLEDNGYIGVTRELMAPVSAEAEVIAHYRNVNALSWFSWLRRGVALLEFETLFPQSRTGTMATGAAADLVGAGFHLGPEENNVDHPTAAAFALAERLTGLHVSAELLDSSSFVLGTVPLRTRA
jgi:hypothetical protein